MRSKMLVAAIATGLGLAGAGVPAAHAQQYAQPAAEVEQLKAQLVALQAKVDELEQRADAQSDINVSAGRNIEAMQKAQADSARTTGPSLAGTKLSGKMYFDFSGIDQKNSDTGTTDASGTGLDVKRFYLGLDHRFDETWSANLTTDFNYVGGDGQTSVYVKKAYVQGRFDPAAVLRIGSADLPWVPFAESYYGFRYVENTLIDRLKYGTSADWGLHLGGELGAGRAASYAVSVVNGGGYKNPSRSKGMDVEARVGFVPFEGMVVALGGYSGHLARETENTDAVRTARRADAMVAYAGKAVRLGAEYFTATNWGNLVLSPVRDKADGYSLWGSVALGDEVSLFARYDRARLSRDLDRAAKDVYYNLGLQYQVTRGFKLAGVWKHQTLDRTVAAPAPPHVQNVKTREIGVFGEVAF